MTEAEIRELRNRVLVHLAEAISCVAHEWDHNASAAIGTAKLLQDAICNAKATEEKHVDHA